MFTRLLHFPRLRQKFVRNHESSGWACFLLLGNNDKFIQWCGTQLKIGGLARAGVG
jgi:hypothetical protein